MRLDWLQNGFISKDLYAPFKVKKDSDYYSDLKKRYNLLKVNAKTANADNESISIIDSYTNRVLKALRHYYKGHISTTHSIIKKIVKETAVNRLALARLYSSDAFPGEKTKELQFFRARINNQAIPYEAKDMLHLPFNMRGKTGNYRFSLPGIPSLYLGNTSYACWLELGRPTEHDFVVSPVVLDGTQNIFNLVVSNREYYYLNDFEPDKVHCWLKLMILMIASSYVIEEEGRTFKSEYIISQSIMLACNELGYDGVAYYSKRVEDQVFAQAAINLALFSVYEYNKEYAKICEHIKVGNSFNYSLFKQLGKASANTTYELRCLRTGIINNIGSYERQYSYADTDFCRFDKFLFSDWKKDDIDFGNAINKK